MRRPSSQAAVERLGNDFDRRVEGNAVARDGVVDLAVRAGGVERALQIGDSRDRRDARGGRFTDSGQQVSDLDAGALAGLIGQNLFSLQAAGGLAPPHAVVGLRKLALLRGD